MTVVVLGASANPERYSNRVLRLLGDHDHDVIPVHPALSEVEGLAVAASLGDIDQQVDTLTVYLRPELAEPMAEAMIALAPRRVIFNPGTESPALAVTLEDAGIETENACTLVLLQSGQF